MHGQAMKLFLEYMTADWEYEYPGQKYDDAHEMIVYFLNPYQNIFVSGASNNTYNYIQNYNIPLYDEYDEGYDSWG
jgi:hypothetical protein